MKLHLGQISLFRSTRMFFSMVTADHQRAMGRKPHSKEIAQALDTPPEKMFDGYHQEIYTNYGIRSIFNLKEMYYWNHVEIKAAQAQAEAEAEAEEEEELDDKKSRSLTFGEKAEKWFSILFLTIPCIFDFVSGLVVNDIILGALNIVRAALEDIFDAAVYCVGKVVKAVAWGLDKVILSPVSKLFRWAKGNGDDGVEVRLVRAKTRFSRDDAERGADLEPALPRHASKTEDSGIEVELEGDEAARQKSDLRQRVSVSKMEAARMPEPTTASATAPEFDMREEEDSDEEQAAGWSSVLAKTPVLGWLFKGKAESDDDADAPKAKTPPTKSKSRKIPALRPSATAESADA